MPWTASGLSRGLVLQLLAGEFPVAAPSAISH